MSDTETSRPSENAGSSSQTNGVSTSDHSANQSPSPLKPSRTRTSSSSYRLSDATNTTVDGVDDDESQESTTKRSLLGAAVINKRKMLSGAADGESGLSSELSSLPASFLARVERNSSQSDSSAPVVAWKRGAPGNHSLMRSEDSENALDPGEDQRRIRHSEDSDGGDGGDPDELVPVPAPIRPKANTFAGRMKARNGASAARATSPKASSHDQADEEALTADVLKRAAVRTRVPTSSDENFVDEARPQSGTEAPEARRQHDERAGSHVSSRSSSHSGHASKKSRLQMLAERRRAAAELEDAEADILAAKPTFTSASKGKRRASPRDTMFSEDDHIELSESSETSNIHEKPLKKKSRYSAFDEASSDDEMPDVADAVRIARAEVEAEARAKKQNAPKKSGKRPSSHRAGRSNLPSASEDEESRDGQDSESSGEDGFAQHGARKRRREEGQSKKGRASKIQKPKKIKVSGGAERLPQTNHLTSMPHSPSPPKTRKR